MLQSLTHTRTRVIALAGSVSLMVVLALGVIGPAAVVGQATRTWVSGVGDDVNPCSRTAPCKTFPGAISKTAAGGEINCLDSGGFGGVTITKSISIICTGVEGGVLVSGTNAIIINAGPTDVVTLRGLDIDGVGTGLNGIKFIAGGALHVQNVLIRRFNAAGAGNGNGILFAPSGTSELYVNDSIITDNGVGNTAGAGIDIQPAAGGSAKVVINNVNVENNNSGIFANAGSAPVKVDVVNSRSTGNTFHGISGIGNAFAVAIMVDGAELSHNGSAGLLCNGTKCTARVGRSVITNNANGIQVQNSGVIQSYSTNQINGNTNDGTPVAIPQS